MRFKLLSIYILSNFFLVSSAYGVMTLLRPANNGSPFPTDTLTGVDTSGNTGQPNTNGNFYYFVYSSQQGSAQKSDDWFYNFNPLDVTKTVSTDPNGQNVLTITVRSDALTNTAQTDASQKYALVVSLLSGGQKLPISIEKINNAACTDQLCLASQMNSGSVRYYAAYYLANQDNQVSFYPQQMCLDIATNTTAGSINGCSSTGLNDPSAADVTLPLAFDIYSVSNPNSTTNPLSSDSNSSVVDSFQGPLNLIFSTAKPQMTCPLINSIQNAIQPQDGQIKILTNVFGLNPYGGTTPYQVWVVSAEQTKKDSIATFSLPSATTNNGTAFASDDEFASSMSQDYLIQRCDSSVTECIMSGLKNSTHDTAYFYSLNFLLEDQMGRIQTFNGCQVSNIQVSEIMGFLNNSRCFIATAAYDGKPAWGVEILREFRDQILLKNAFGKKINTWYLEYSLKPAYWLMQNPAIRPLVKAALFPFQLCAWVFLHPFLAMALIGMVFTIKKVKEI